MVVLEPRDDHRPGFLPGVVIGLVLAVVLFAIDYGRIELVREVAFGDTYHSNVDRPPGERAELRALARSRPDPARERVRVSSESTNRLARADQAARGDRPAAVPGIDLRRVTGVDSSAVVAFVKVMRLAEASGVRDRPTGTSDPVRAQLERGGVAETGVLRFEPDLDRGLQRCEDALLTADPGPRGRRRWPPRRPRGPAPGARPLPGARVVARRHRPAAPGRATRATSTCSRRAISG